MYYLNDFCCICLNNDDHLITLSEKDEDGLTYFQKLTDCVPEMNSEEIDPDKFICVGCIDGLDEVYYFRMMCIENKIVFLDYLTKLTSVGQKNSFLDVKVLDIHGKDKKKQKKQTKTKDNVARSNFHKKMKLSLDHKKQNAPTVSTSLSCNGNNPETPEIKLKIFNNSIVRQNNPDILGNKPHDLNTGKVENNPETTGSNPKVIENKPKTIGNKFKIIGNKLKKVESIPEMIGNNSEVGSKSEVNGIETKKNMIKNMLGNNSKTVESDRSDTTLNDDRKTIDNDAVNLENDLPNCSNPIVVQSPFGNNLDASNIYNSDIKQEILDINIIDNQIKEEPLDIIDTPVEIKQEMIEDESKENNIFNDVIPDKIGAKLMKMTLNDDEMFASRENDYEDNQMSTSSCSNNSLESKPFHSKIEQDTRLKPMNVPIKRISSTKEIFCKFCEQTFEERKSLETHVCKDKVITQTDCKYCYKHFKTANDLCEHLCDGYEQNSLFRCDICNVIFPTQLKLINHQNVRHGTIKHQCRICEKGFGHLMPLRDHLTNEHRVKPHICDICNKSYVHPRDLRTHINRHKGWKPYNCRLCNRDFFGQSELRRHMKSHD